MNRLFPLFLITLTIGVAAAPTVPTKLPFGHPLIGKWQWTRDKNSCTEVYEFKTDGSAPVVSGTENTENAFTVTTAPDSNGFYRVTMRVTKDRGGKDCADDESDSTGIESTTFVRFNPDLTIYVTCEEAKLEHCFGPLRRLSP